MKLEGILLWLVGGYVAIGVYKCFTASSGTDYNSQTCSSKTVECVLKWPLWNASKCNTHF